MDMADFVSLNPVHKYKMASLKLPCFDLILE